MAKSGVMWEVGYTPWTGITACDGRHCPWFVATTIGCSECGDIVGFKDSGILGRGTALLLAGPFTDVSKEHLSSEMPGNADLHPQRHTRKKSEFSNFKYRINIFFI
jgi:hypothetical protein